MRFIICRFLPFLLILALCLTGCAQPQGGTPTDGSAETTAPETTAPVTEPSAEVPTEEPTQPQLAFPEDLGSGLQADSLILYSGPNPDNDWEEGTNIGTLNLTNSGSAYLVSAILTATMSDGSELHFTITDLPAGKSCMAFEVENGTIPQGVYCVTISCVPEFAEDAGIGPEQVAAEAQGMQVTLTNLTDSDIGPLSVRCRCMLEGTYFGGIASVLPVGSIPAGESAELFAVDCFLGDAEVVRILPE